MLDLDPIKARLERLEQSSDEPPWLVYVQRGATGAPLRLGLLKRNGEPLKTGISAALIAHAPEDIAALIAEVERLRLQNDVMRRAAKHHISRRGLEEHDGLLLTPMEKWLLEMD